MKIGRELNQRGLVSGLAAVAVIALLPGCAFIPPLKASGEIRPVDSLETTKSFAEPAAAWPESQWWRDYHDPQLDALIDEALKESPDLTIAAARVRMAGAGVQAVEGALLPQVTADAAVTEEKQSYNYLIPAPALPRGLNDYGQVTLEMGWDLDFWGKNRAALSAAITDREAARAEQAEVRLLLSAAVASAYADLAHLYTVLDTAKAALVVREKTADLFHGRQKNGLETLGSVRQVEARVKGAEAEVLALQENITLVKIALAALVGAGPDRALEISRPKIDVNAGPGLPANLALQLIGRRPDIVVARLRAEAAAKRIEQHEAEFYPNVDLMAIVGTQSLRLDNLAKPGSMIGSIGPAISLPIFNRAQLKAGLEGAYADYDLAVAGYNQTLLHALREVADAATSRRLLENQLQTRNQAYQLAKEAHSIASHRYQGGLTTFLDVLTAEDQMLSAQRSLSEMQTRAFTLNVALIRSLGGGYGADPEKKSDLN
jgi:NodT family efflux transporter outer membrane factor (OMF) lipoprotein